jgi:hypothetical protein
MQGEDVASKSGPRASEPAPQGSNKAQGGQSGHDPAPEDRASVS